MPHRDRLLPTAAALVTVTLWASAFVGIRAAGRDIAPGGLALARLAIGSLVLGVIAIARGEKRPDRRAVPGILLCGLLWFALYNVALNSAERRVDAGTASMLVNVGPIFLAILAGFVLREGFPRLLIAGCVISFAGIVVIAVASHSTSASTAGAVLCVAAAAAYAGGVVCQKVVLRTVSPLETTFLCCVVGATVCLPFAPSLIEDLHDARSSTIGWIVYLGTMPTALAFTTWAYALSRSSAGRLGAVTYLVPPISILLGWIVLDEVPAALAFVGGAVCLAGVAVTRRS